ncbi:MAG: hypothetical protein HQK96_14765, partial [Nitrospirae bacterium]|nr:hypothetical protein [Nitrospirota bacterium]
MDTDNVENEKHPVWDVYNEYRTARLNVRCNEMYLRRLTRTKKWMNMAIAISTSSTVGGFWVAETPWFTYFWKGFGTL